MDKIKQIHNKINKNINNNSIMIYYSASLNDIPPFMCSPYNEEWIWSNNTNDLVEYIFEVVLATYLVNDIVAYGCNLNAYDETCDFETAIKIYKDYYSDNDNRIKSLDELNNLYKDNKNREESYFDLVNLLIKIENICPYIGIDIIFESFSTPLETRNSKYLKTQVFDFEKLENNF